MKELEHVMFQVGAVETLLASELGDAIEGCSLLESVALLVSQRENARNAHAATQERCEKLECALDEMIDAVTHGANISTIKTRALLAAK